MKKDGLFAVAVACLAIFIIVLVLSLFATVDESVLELRKVQKAAVAGSWYPADKSILSFTVGNYLRNSPEVEINGTVRAVIVPHAGYQYSGRVAAAAFRQLNSNYGTVFILGPAHRYALVNVSVLNVTDFETPLGNIKVSDKVQNLFSENFVKEVPEAYSQEHSLESEMPFLQTQLPELKIAPVLVGEINPQLLKQMLDKYMGNNDLIVVSVDLSHYHDYETAKELDSFSIGRIMNMDYSGIFNAEIDAPFAVSALLMTAKEKGWKPVLVDYKNSGDVTGDKSSVVGYSAIAFVEEKQLLTEKEQEFLLNLSRAVLDNYVKTGSTPKIDESKLTDAMKKQTGCFVTLNKNNELRGCIGHILPQKPLYKCVIDNTINAAANDQRFLPVQLPELDKIKIEISVLTVPQRLTFSTGEDLKSKLIIRDGVVLKQLFKEATYLPQVWEQLPDKELFLASLCEKGNMDKNCWKSTATEAYTYQAFVFWE